MRKRFLSENTYPGSKSLLAKEERSHLRCAPQSYSCIQGVLEYLQIISGRWEEEEKLSYL